MRNEWSWRRRYVSISASFVIGLLISLPGFAQTLSQIAPSPIPRVQGPVIESQVVTLQGQVHPLAQARFDQGVVPDSTPAQHVILLLQRTPQQEAMAAAIVDQLHNRNSALYHQWLSAEQFGQSFGPADSDIAALTGWLQQKGFTIDDVPPGRTHITFSGTAGQMRQAFNAEFHSLNVNGQKHVAVLKGPTIPAALAPIVRGFRQLNDWGPKPNFVPATVMRKNPKTGAWEKVRVRKSAPELTSGGEGNYEWDIGPQDWYTIYNANPLLTSSSPVNGAGVTIAVIEETEIQNQVDITDFRSAFGLPAYPATPNATEGGINYLYGPGHGCTAPAVLESDGEEGEALLDTEWAGAGAPNAIVDFVACNSGATIGSYGTDLAASYVANYLYSTVSVTSLSYGECEYYAGSSGTLFYYDLWQQEAAEGITAVVSSGDAGSATCYQNDEYAEGTISTSAMSSSPYNISAGGTDFSDVYQVEGNAPTTYWNTTGNGTGFSSALSYVPEVSWGGYCSNPLFASYVQAIGFTSFGTTYTPEALCNNAGSQSEGYLAVVGGTGGISEYNTIPTWQSVFGIGAGTTSTTYRNEPDLSFFAGNGLWNHALAYCQSDAGASCTYTNRQDVDALTAGGTSFVAPAIAGVMGLINQKYGRQGVANYTLYNLAAQEYGTEASRSSTIGNCSGSALGGAVGSTCIFHDIANDTPCLAGSTMCGTGNGGFAGSGSGSGALNAASITSDNVEPCLYSSSTNCYRANSSDTYGLTAVGNHTSAPAYRTAQGFDLATGLGSLNVANLVNKWNSVSADFATTTSLVPNPATLTISSPSTVLTATVTASGRGGKVAASGLIKFYLGSTGGTLLGTGPLTQTCTGLASPVAGTAACSASAALTLSAANVLEYLSTGSNSLVAYFGGDGANDAPSTSPAVTVTVNASNQTITFPNPGTQTYGVAPLTLNATASSGLSVGYSVTSGPATVSGSTLTITGAGSVTVQATQTGNTYYTAATPVSVTFTVNTANREAQTITFANPGTQTYGTPLTLVATASSGLTVSYASTTPSVCTVSGNTVTFVTTGTCGIVASQAGNSDYSPAPAVGHAFTVAKGAQTITFARPGTQTYGTPLTLTATASSGLTVSFASTTTSVCTVSGSTVTFVTTGTCGIVANQTGNSDYSAAPQVGHAFTVAKGAQTITFARPGTQTYGTPLTLAAEASSGLTVSFVSTTTSVCTVSGSTVTFVTTGTCGIVASQAGNSDYAAATAVGHAFTVAKGAQTITFPNPGTQRVGAVVTLTATARSGLVVSYTSTNTSVCTVSGSQSTMVAVGTCGIFANQAGNADYSAAPQVGHAFTVTAAN